MTSFSRSIAALTLGLAALGAQAHESFQRGELAIEHVRARATAPGQPAGAGYLSIRNTGRAGDKLVAASAEVAERTELHEMKMDGNVMRMREVAAIEVPAGKTVELRPGGLHIMLMGLKAPLKQGERFALTLRFEQAGEVTVQVAVEGAGAGGHSQHQHQHQHHKH